MTGAVSGTEPPPNTPSRAAVLVAQFFLPLNVVASQRALRMARTLLSRFDRVYVLCGDTTAVDPRLLDREYGRELLENPRLVRVPVRPALGGYGYAAAPSRSQRLIGGVATRLLCGPGVDWVRPLRSALAKIPQSEVGLVIATGAPFITFGAAATLAEARSVPLILDYRDLWTSNPHGPYPALARSLVNRIIERPVNRKAASITTVSDGCRASLVANGTAVPVRVLYNSPDRPYLDHYRRVVAEWNHRRVGLSDRARQRFRIVFTGQVYRNCTFAPLLKAIKTLPASVAERIVLEYYGDSSLVARTECQEFGLSQLLSDHGPVSKDDSLRAMLDADLLLSLIHTDRESSDPAVTGHMSTKIYDYLLSGVPILNIGPVNAEVNGFAVRVGHPAFHTLPADETAAMARLLEDMVSTPQRPKWEALHVALPDFESTFSTILDEVRFKPR